MDNGVNFRGYGVSEVVLSLFILKCVKGSCLGLYKSLSESLLLWNLWKGVTDRVSRRSILGVGSTPRAWVLTDQRLSDTQKGGKRAEKCLLLSLTMRKSIVCRNVNFNGSGKGGHFVQLSEKCAICLFRCNCNVTIKSQIINNCCFLLIPWYVALLNTLHYHNTQYIYLSACAHEWNIVQHADKMPMLSNTKQNALKSLVFSHLRFLYSVYRMNTMFFDMHLLLFKKPMEIFFPIILPPEN